MNESSGRLFLIFIRFIRSYVPFGKETQYSSKALWGLNSLHIKRRKKKRPSIFTLLFP